MSYYFSKTIKDKNFEEVVDLVSKELQKEGFGIITDIDVQATFKKKLDIDFRKYRILGACNPHFAHEALNIEDQIGVFLPCNVVVEEYENGDIEVVAVDPVASMMSVNNDALEEQAMTIQHKLTNVISHLE